MLAGGFGVWGHPACALSRFGARVSPWVFALHSGVLAGWFGVWGHPACALSRSARGCPRGCLRCTRGKLNGRHSANGG
jgi:hypothetical protein